MINLLYVQENIALCFTFYPIVPTGFLAFPSNHVFTDSSLAFTDSLNFRIIRRFGCSYNLQIGWNCRLLSGAMLILYLFIH